MGHVSGSGRAGARWTGGGVVAALGLALGALLLACSPRAADPMATAATGALSPGESDRRSTAIALQGIVEFLSGNLRRAERLLRSACQHSHVVTPNP